jgi:hypothetical protein
MRAAVGGRVPLPRAARAACVRASPLGPARTALPPAPAPPEQPTPASSPAPPPSLSAERSHAALYRVAERTPGGGGPARRGSGRRRHCDKGACGLMVVRVGMGLRLVLGVGAGGSRVG